MKIQIFLEPHQAELVIRCLKFVQGKLNSEAPLSAVHAMAGQYTHARISEVLAIFEAKRRLVKTVDAALKQGDAAMDGEKK